MSLLDQDDQEELGLEKSDNMLIRPTTLASIESLTIPLVQQVVILADFRCKRCQERVAEILSRMNGEAESVEMSVLEKKVTLTLTRQNPRVVKVPTKQVQDATIYKNSVKKFTLIRRLLPFSCN